jgi:hypothetical protein
MTFIDTVRARAALKPRKDPTGKSSPRGLAIGLRVMEGAAPTWTIRYRNATGKQVYKPLGNLLEILETKRFDYCHGLALKFWCRNNKGVSTPFRHRRRRLRRLRGRPPRKEGASVLHTMPAAAMRAWCSVHPSGQSWSPT